MKAANRLIDDMQKNLGSLTGDSEAAAEALDGVKLDTSQVLTSIADAKRLQDAIDSVTTAAGLAQSEIGDVGFQQMQIAMFELDASRIVSKLNNITDEANQAKRAMAEMSLGSMLASGFGAGSAGAAGRSNQSELIRLASQQSARSFFANEAAVRNAQRLSTAARSDANVISTIAERAGQSNQAELLRIKMLSDATRGVGVPSLDYTRPIGPVARPIGPIIRPTLFGSKAIPMPAASSHITEEPGTVAFFKQRAEQMSLIPATDLRMYAEEQAKRDLQQTGWAGMFFGSQTVRRIVSDAKSITGGSLLGVLSGPLGGGGSGGYRIPFTGGGFFGRRGGGIRIGRGLPRVGSLLALGGFGAEHAITATLGVAGSLGQGLIGGGLLGAGALGVVGVGIGTDLAGIGQAAGDTKKVSTDISSLNSAISTYGRNSTEAAQAQAQLNTDLKGFSSVARAAVLQAAQTSQGFKGMFDQLTGPAEKTGANILNQIMLTGESFLPSIGTFAAQNMKIIQADIQPFFSWLKSTGSQGGLGIFDNLEKIFQKNLPNSIGAITQGLEFFARTINVAAGYTGGLTKKLDDFFTKMNQPGSFSGWATEIGKLISQFDTWISLLGSVGRLLVGLFTPGLGFGQKFVEMLTGIIKQVTTFVDLNSTQTALQGLFSAHLNQVIGGIGAVLKSLLPLLEQTVLLFIQISTVASNLVASGLGAVARAIKELLSYHLASEMLALLLVVRIFWSAIKSLWVLMTTSGLRTAIQTFFTEMVSGWTSVGTAATTSSVVVDEAMAAEAAATVGVTTEVGLLRGSLLSLGSVSVLGALGALGAALLGVYQLKEALNNKQSVSSAQKAGDFALFGTASTGAIVGGTSSAPKYAAVGSHITFQGHTGIVADIGGSLFLMPEGPQPAGVNPATNPSALGPIETPAMRKRIAAMLKKSANPFPFLNAYRRNTAGAASSQYGDLPVAFVNALNQAQAFPGKNNVNLIGYTQAALTWLEHNYQGAGGNKGADEQAISFLRSSLQAAQPFQGAGPGANKTKVPGFGGSTSAGGKVFNLKNALAQAMATGSGVDTQKQVSLANAYERAAAAAYKSLQAQVVPATQLVAKQAELTKLAQDEAAARKDITTILGRQYTQNVRVVSAAVTTAKQTFTSAMSSSSGMTAAQQVTAANQYLKVLAQQQVKLQKQVDLDHARVAAAIELKRIQADIKVATNDRTAARIGGRIANILGLGTVPLSTGAAAGRRSEASTRTFLNETLKSFGLAQTGSNPLAPYVKELFKAGDISKSQDVSLKKILASINLMKSDTGKIDSSLTGNISQRLAEIKQELAVTGFFGGNAVNVRQVLAKAGINIPRGGHGQINEALAAAAAFKKGYQISLGAGSVLGVPLNRNGSPATTIHVKVSGETRISKENAKEIAAFVADVFQSQPP